MSQTISFKIDDEIYLRLSALGAELGISPHQYVKRIITMQEKAFINDLKSIKTDLQDLLSREYEGTEKSESDALLEILLILRHIAPPQKLKSAYAELENSGINITQIS